MAITATVRPLPNPPPLRRGGSRSAARGIPASPVAQESERAARPPLPPFHGGRLGWGRTVAAYRTKEAMRASIGITATVRPLPNPPPLRRGGSRADPVWG